MGPNAFKLCKRKRYAQDGTPGRALCPFPASAGASQGPSQVVVFNVPLNYGLLTPTLSRSCHHPFQGVGGCLAQSERRGFQRLPAPRRGFHVVPLRLHLEGVLAITQERRQDVAHAQLELGVFYWRCDLDPPNTLGMTPLDVATKMERKDAIEYLQIKLRARGLHKGGGQLV